MSPIGQSPRAEAVGVPAWLPNAISVLRILLVPVFIWLAAECQQRARTGLDDDSARAGAFAVLAVIGLSDVLDGWLARRYRLCSRLGASLDALADKIAQVGLLLFFTLDRGPAFPRVQVWFLVLILARDLIMASGWLILRAKAGGARVMHRAHGKLSSVLIFALLLWITTGMERERLPAAMFVIAAVVVASTASYFRDGWVQLKAATRGGMSEE